MAHLARMWTGCWLTHWWQYTLSLSLSHSVSIQFRSNSVPLTHSLSLCIQMIHSLAFWSLLFLLLVDTVVIALCVLIFPLLLFISLSLSDLPSCSLSIFCVHQQLLMPLQSVYFGSAAVRTKVRGQFVRSILLIYNFKKMIEICILNAISPPSFCSNICCQFPWTDSLSKWSLPIWWRVIRHVFCICALFRLFSSHSIIDVNCCDPLHLSLSLKVCDRVSPSGTGGCDWNSMCFVVTAGDSSGAFWFCANFKFNIHSTTNFGWRHQS